MGDSDLARIFETAGCDGALHAVDLTTGCEVAWRADELVVPASVFKIAVALDLFDRAASGELDLGEQVTVEPSYLPSNWGLAEFEHPARLALGDLCYLMMAISDGIATDLLMARLGLDALNQRFVAWRMSNTRIATDIQGLVDGLARDLGFESGREALAAEAGERGDEARARAQDRARIQASSVLDPVRTSRTTARDMTTLLTAIWRDEAAAPSACARVRAVMTKQVVQEKLASGFSADPSWEGGVLYAKSGSLFGLVINEVGVIQEPGGRCYAVAVFTRAHRIYEGRDARSHAIGAAARMAVETLRSQEPTRQLSKTSEERGTAER